MQTLLGHIERWLAYSQAPLEDCAGEKVKKKCFKCGEVKPLTVFHKDKRNKDGHNYSCKKCVNARITMYKKTEKGYLKMRYDAMFAKERVRTWSRWGRPSKCYINFKELWAAWEKHKSIYGMKSAWGPGVNNLEQHLPMTMIFIGKGQEGKKGAAKGTKRTASNLSVDRLDPNLDYTLQNIIFIRGDENVRKKDTTYEDCKIQIRLYEERFKNEVE